MSEQPLNEHALHEEENKLIAQRKEKLAAVRESQAIAFPNDFRRDSYCSDLQKQYAEAGREELEAQQIKDSEAGRSRRLPARSRARGGAQGALPGRLRRGSGSSSRSR
jgi:lysyl-tRNA synthetase class II